MLGRLTSLGWLPVVAVIVVGAWLAAVVTATGWQAEVAATDEQFRRDARDRAAAVHHSLQARLAAVRSVAEFFAASDDVTADDFRVYAGALLEHHWSLDLLAWATCEQDVGGTLSACPRLEMVYVEPPEGRERLVSRDPDVERLRAEALQRAVERGSTQLTGPEIGIAGGGAAVVALMPVYRRGAPMATDRERWDAVVGAVCGLILVDQLVEEALSRLEPAPQRLEMHDVSEGRRELLCDYQPESWDGTEPSWHSLAGGQRWAGEIEMGGRRLELLVTPSRAGYRHDWLQDALLGSTTLMLAFVVAGFVLQLLRRERRVRELVEVRTAELSHRASHDPLTGLVNRTEFERQLRLCLEECRGGGPTATLGYLDLDHFKIVNDTAGHAAGDALLRQMGPLLESGIRSGDTLARLGGDEFGLLLRGCTIHVGAELVGRLVDRIASHRFPWHESTFSVGASVGLVQVDASVDSAATALSRADAACYLAKEKGGRRVHVASIRDSESDVFRREMEWVLEIRSALEQGRLELWCQPIVDLRPSAGSSERFEVLLRLRREDGELTTPGSFLSAAERFRLLPEIDRWVVQSLLARLDPASATAPATWWVNLTGQSLEDHDFAEFVVDRLRQSGIDPGALCFEIAEADLSVSLARGRRTVERLRSEGCRFALDDFGSGAASFQSLKSLPVDFVKIDGEYVGGLADDEMDRALVGAVHDVASSIGIPTVAECVETADLLEVVRALGVDFAQGHHLGRPRPLHLPDQ